ncbi:MAG: hypothetical protein EBX52_04175 [Proteobacteria bacterium]|nr:hypothetical protein [Pseudomonadota bacterium]
MLLTSCVRNHSLRKEREFYEETPSGYYQGEETPKKGEALDRLKGPKKKVLVLSFWNDTPTGDDSLGDFVASELKREFSLGHQILLPDDKLVTSVTKDFVEGDRVQVSQLVREGRRFGVSSVILGRISKIVFRQNREEVGILRQAESVVSVELEMKVFDVSSGREVGTYARTGAAANSARIVIDEDTLSSREARNDLAKEAIYEAVQKLIPDVVLALEKMEWQGRIAKIAGNKVYINAGRASGLLSGDILKVLSPGEEIVDPVTKSFLGRSEGFLKGTLEVSDFIGTDSSMTVIHTGGNFQEGDVVRLY